ncbi:hypothetical protein SKAU_G00422910 [Synaphobranchus kaupii]|uniref:Box C/D snoRNA protein 1 n=1 Tax=Synaphobranchus kaupii TaxID=118154 RepID=A0A9Q1E5B8_SYNKA|nr:hypothetical protein SKAU_G00422910 [Synaphobranchus kaupii]
MESFIVSKSEHDDSVEEVKRKKRKISLANCGTCGAEEAKYRCPGCLKHSCSLPCVKKHKSESGCSGTRDKTAFVPISKFDEMSLLSDYRFLEDTGRLVDSTHRDPLVQRPLTTKYTKMMMRKAHSFNLRLKLLPPGFSRRCENSTFFHKKAEQFFWHLKLLFPQSAAEYTQYRVPDDRTLQQVLSPYIHPTESEPVRRQRLKAYVLAPPDQVKVFMKVENRSSNCARYHELDVQKTLRENLRFKLVVEYPQFHITLREHCKNYPLFTPESRAGPWITTATKPAWPGDEGGDVTSYAELTGTVPSCGDRAACGDDDDDEMEEGEIRDEEYNPADTAPPSSTGVKPAHTAPPPGMELNLQTL